MDFNDTSDEAAYRAKARAWLEKNAKPLDPTKVAPSEIGEREDAATIQWCKDWQAKKADAGWACITWPKELGGQDATPMQRVIFNQEEARFRVPPPIYAIGHGMLGPTIMAHGTPEQKKKYLPNMLRGAEVWCQLFSEPAAGSDLAGLRMSAVKEGNDWVLNGQKIWSTGAHFCDWGMVVTRTDTNAAKHAGLTYFIVDMRAPGIEVRPIRQINGASGFNEVFFTNMRTPDSNRLGAIGDGWRVALTTLMNERAAIGGGGAGLGNLGFGRFRDMARHFQLADDPITRQRLADIYVRQQVARFTNLRAMAKIRSGALPGPEMSIGKLALTANMQRIAQVIGEILGPRLVADTGEWGAYAWSEFVLGIPGLRIAGGTDEVMRNIVGERVLGLPKEPRGTQ